MKTLLKHMALFVALTFTSALTASAIDIEFAVYHNTGTGTVYAMGTYDIYDVGGFPPLSGVATGPASDLWSPFYNPNNLEVDVRAYVDSSYSVGKHYIGYFPGGSDCYLFIWN